MGWMETQRESDSENRLKSTPFDPGESASDPSVLQYKLDAEDLIAASALMVDVDPAAQKAIRTGLIIRPLIFLPAIALMVWQKAWASAIILLFIAIYFMLGVRRMSRRGAAGKVRKGIERGEYRDFDQPTTLVADPAGLQTRSKTSDLQLNWNQIHRVIETFECLLIYITHESAILVPRQCVTSGDFDAFRGELERYIAVQKLQTGETYRDALRKLETDRHQRRKSRAWHAFFLGMISLLVFGFLTLTATILSFPGLQPPGPYFTLILIFPAGVGIAAAAWRATQLTQLDHETRCRRCQYILRSLTEPKCPECGQVI